MKNSTRKQQNANQNGRARKTQFYIFNPRADELSDKLYVNLYNRQL